MSDGLLQWMLTTAAALEWADDSHFDPFTDGDEWHDRDLCDCLECENWREAQLSHALGSGESLADRSRVS